LKNGGADLEQNEGEAVLSGISQEALRITLKLGAMITVPYNKKFKREQGKCILTE